MGSKSHKDWMRSDRYLTEAAPSSVNDAAQCVLAARTALRLGRKEIALHLYVQAARLWKNLERKDPGHWREAQAGTRRELRALIERH